MRDPTHLQTYLWTEYETDKDPSIDFRRQSVFNHQDRSERAATALVMAKPERFPLLAKRLDIVTMRFLRHDIVKTMSAEDLKAYGYITESDVLTDLAPFWGRNREALDEKESTYFAAILESFNTIENQIKMHDLKQLGFDADHEIVKELEDLELIIDSTDTGIYRKEEFGLSPNSKYNGAKFLIESGREELATLAQYTEDNYVLWLENSTIQKPTE
jgi:hypothetical protein